MKKGNAGKRSATGTTRNKSRFMMYCFLVDQNGGDSEGRITQEMDETKKIENQEMDEFRKIENQENG
jgi:hypothetical protein